MTPWKARSLRLTFFVTSEGATRLESLEWESLTGSKPENIVNRGQQQFQEGVFRSARLILQKQVGRIDAGYVGFPRPDEQEEPVATIGTLEDSWAELQEVKAKLFGATDSITRVALGVELVRPAETVQEAYAILVDHMRSASFKLTGGHDFIYQINRPRKSKSYQDLIINRLTRWNATSWQPVTFELATGPRAVSGPPRIGAVIATDINTDAEKTTPLDKSKFVELFDEFYKMTLEIRDKGDVE